MEVNLISSISLILLIFVNVKGGSANRRCNMTRVDAEGCARRLMIGGDRDQYVFSNVEEAKTFCK